MQRFAEYFGRSPEQMGGEFLRRYQLYLLHERKLALGTVENCISALRFLCKKTLTRCDLAFDEVTRLNDAATNRMHRMRLMLLYTTGMLLTDASRLKLSDIDSQRMVIHIH